MKKTTGIKPLLLTFCAVGVLSAMSQPWAAEITNCAEVTAVTEGDVDSLPDGRLDPAVPEDDESCVAVTVVTPVSVGDYIWIDSNKDGKQDNGENPLAGAVVTLLDSSGQPAKDIDGNNVTAQTTGADGKYLFSNLPEGEYQVVVVPPTGYIASPNAGDVDAVPANDDSNCAADGKTALFNLNIGQEPTDDGDTDANSNLGVDCGFYKPPEPVSVGDTIWLDTNKDGKQDTGEAGISGVTVKLFDKDGNPVKDLDGNDVADQTTDANGKYLFNNLPEGDYTIEVVKPTSYEFTTQGTDPNAVNDSNCSATDGKMPVFSLTAGGESITDGDTDPNSDLTEDCGLYQPTYSIGNRVWIDANNNGLADVGELPAMSGVSLELKDDQGNSITSTTTDAEGRYLFSGLEMGSYQVCVAASNFSTGGVLVGYTASTGGNVADANTDIDGDDNGDDDTSTGLCSNVVVLDNHEPLLEATATGPNGNDGAGTPDANSNLTVDFGVVPPVTPVSVGNYIWEDTNKDGKQDTGESGIAGVTVKLRDKDGNPVKDLDGTDVADQTTDADGKYLFNNLPEGDYTIEVVKPTGYEFTTQGTDPNAVNDSNCSATDGKIPVFTLTAGGESITDGDIDPNSDLTEDCGLYQPTPTAVSVGDTIWEDTNKDGKQDTGEPGIAGVTVKLRDKDGNPVKDLDGTDVADQTTDANGKYLFDNLPEGDYTIEVVKPTGYEFTTQGTDPNAVDDSNCSATDGKMPVFTLTAGGESITDGDTDPNSDLTEDCGLYQPVEPLHSIGNRVWIDANNDGKRDATESPVPDGVVMTLKNSDTGNTTQVITTNGYYLFPLLDSGNYKVCVDASNFTLGGKLEGYTASTVATVDDPNNDVDDDDNGSDVVTDGLCTAVALALGSDEPLTEADTASGTPGDDGLLTDDNLSNLTVDFAVVAPVEPTPKVSVGDIIWEDTNHDGKQDTGEPGIADVTVTLLDKDGNVVKTVQTDVNGKYLFSDLPEGDYSITVTPPADYQFTTPGTDTTANDDSNCAVDGKTVLFNLKAGEESTTDGDTDANSDLTQDCGLYKPATPTESIGNRVWTDSNNNGVADVGEYPVGAGVAMILKDADGNQLETTQTDANGRYLFTDIVEGSYQVCVAASNFTSGGMLEGYVGSTGVGEKTDANLGADGSPDSGIDGDDNGSNDVTVGLCSNLVVLNDKEPLLETTATGDDGNDGTGTPDNRSNLTIDFGIVPPAETVSVGDKMWVDLDADGKQDQGEPGLEGVTIKLLDKDGNVVATQVSKPDGSYLFTGLPEGQYNIAVIPPALYNIPTIRGGDVDSTPANDDSNCSSGGTTGLFTLTVGQEPTDDGDTDANSNLSVDCGFVPHLQIPTLSQWGLAIMSMLLATAAFFRRCRED